MYIYILCFIVSSFCIWQSEIVKSKKIKILFEVLGILIICTLAGLRSDEIGTDVGIYCKPLYEQAETSTSFRDYLSKRVTNSRIVSDYEIGFITLVFLCAKIFENFQILLFAIQLLIVVPIFKGIKIISKKENNRIWLSMLIFYCMFYNVSLNLMRQFIAIGFIFLGTANLISNENKKNIKFVICLLIGFLFHSSALMGLLIYALYKVINHSYKKVRIGNINIPLKQIATVLISITGIFLLINNNILVTILNLFDMQYYTRYIEGNVSFLTSTVFKLLPVIFLFAFSNKKELKNKNNNSNVYNENDEFVYKGKNAQNYVVFNGDIYRIIKVDKFRHTYLIRETNDVINKNDIENYINYYNNDNFSENAVNKMWGKTEILTNALYKQTILNGSSFINVDNNVWLKDEDTYKAITINNEFTNEEKANMFIVIKLNNNVVITSGEGTQINPYVVED